MTQRFNPYHQWLGISKKKSPPTHYDLLGVTLDEEETSVIQNAAQRQRTHVEQYKAGEHFKHAKQVIYQIDEAELTLLDTELRRNYDNQVGLFGKRKRKRSRRFERVGGKSRPYSGGVGQSSGFFREYLGVMSVILACFVVMAIVSFTMQSKNDDGQRGAGTSASNNSAPAAMNNGNAVADSVPTVVPESPVTAQPSADAAETTVMSPYPADAIEFDGHRYKFFGESVSWKDAKQRCEKLDGHLVTIQSEGENQFLTKLLRDAGRDSWLGASDEVEEGNWKWVDDGALNQGFTKWLSLIHI